MKVNEERTLYCFEVTLSQPRREVFINLLAEMFGCRPNTTFFTEADEFVDRHGLIQ